jgi:hypothetical protein
MMQMIIFACSFILSLIVFLSTFISAVAYERVLYKILFLGIVALFCFIYISWKYANLRRMAIISMILPLYAIIDANLSLYFHIRLWWIFSLLFSNKS